MASIYEQFLCKFWNNLAFADLPISFGNEILNNTDAVALRHIEILIGLLWIIGKVESLCFLSFYRASLQLCMFLIQWFCQAKQELGDNQRFPFKPKFVLINVPVASSASLLDA